MKAKKLLFDLFSMVLVGDGLLTVLDPKRHCLIWEVGPESCREMVDGFAQRPAMARWAGAAEVLIGLTLAQAQQPSFWKRLRNSA
jgi:uncharacterized protein YjeT (DUF2065 family)